MLLSLILTALVWSCNFAGFMLYLLLTIALNAYLFVAFKIFERFKIDTLQAIVVNYWTCVATGSISLGHFPVSAESFSMPWIGWAALMGASFISIFNLIAYCTKADGITTTTIANKLSMVIPAGFALWLYAERLNWTKGLGILIAFPAVYLSTRVKSEAGRKPNLLLPAVLFAGSGLLDTLVNFVSKRFFTGGDRLQNAAGQNVFLIHTFSAAGTLGALLVAYLLITGKRAFAWKNVLAGIVLGVPNYFSIYYLFQLLASGFLPGSAAIPVNNIGIVLAASLTAMLVFGERANAGRIVGMLLSIAAILLIMLSDLHAGA